MFDPANEAAARAPSMPLYVFDDLCKDAEDDENASEAPCRACDGGRLSLERWRLSVEMVMGIIKPYKLEFQSTGKVRCLWHGQPEPESVDEVLLPTDVLSPTLAAKCQDHLNLH